MMKNFAVIGTVLISIILILVVGINKKNSAKSRA